MELQEIAKHYVLHCSQIKIRSGIYINISNKYVKYGNNKYTGDLLNIEYYELDIEKWFSIKNDTLLHSADMIIPSNAIHAKSNSMKSITNRRSLIKARGVIVLHESIEFQNYLTLTFGLLDISWRYEDTGNCITNSPLLSFDVWSNLFKSCGFRKIVSYNQQLGDNAISFQDVIVVQL